MEDKKTAQSGKSGASDLDVVCPCGSGELAGACCMSAAPCPCGSGLRAGECCYASPPEDEE